MLSALQERLKLINFKLPTPNTYYSLEREYKKFGFIYNRTLGYYFNPYFKENINKLIDQQNIQSSSFQDEKNLDQIYIKIKKNYKKKIKILEIGTGNDGIFYKKLKNLSTEITGYDPSYNGKDASIKKKIFDYPKKKFDLIIIRHVLEHIKNPVNFLLKLKKNYHNADVYIEVPNFDYSLKNNKITDLMYEHTNYFTKKFFKDFFKKIFFLNLLNNDQFISCFANLENIKIKSLNNLNNKKNLQKTNFINKNFKLFLKNLKKLSGDIFIYGIAGRGITLEALLNFAGYSNKVKCIFDNDKRKSWKIIGSNSLQILPEELIEILVKKDDTILFTNINHQKKLNKLLLKNRIKSICF